VRTLPILVAAAACALPLPLGATDGPATVAGTSSATAPGPSASGAQGVLALPGGIVWSTDSAG